MLYRHQLPDGSILAFRLKVAGASVTLSTGTGEGTLVRKFVLENDDFDPAMLVHLFLNQPLTAEEKLRFARPSPGCVGHSHGA